MSDLIVMPPNGVKEAILKTYIVGYEIDSELQNGDRNRRYFIIIPTLLGKLYTRSYSNPDFAIMEAYKMVRSKMGEMAGIIEREDK